MEKFRIAQYGCLQMLALAYGILGSGAILKAFDKISARGGITPFTSPFASFVHFYHDYGIFLSLGIILWASLCAYHTSFFSRFNFDETPIVVSGLILTAIFFIIGTFLIMALIVANLGPGI